MIIFEWDENKNLTNKKKHGISFDEILAVFSDDNAIIFDDPELLILGMNSDYNVYVGCHCYRMDNDTIRFISARRANIKEVDYYDRQL